MKKRIMVVDDDPDILISIRKIFEKQGYEVFTVDSGIDCINEIENGFKGPVLLDIMMPFMDGWDTIEELNKKNLLKNVIISILTAKGTRDHDKLKGLQNKIFDYITKPFNVKNLLKNVEKMVS